MPDSLTISRPQIELHIEAAEPEMPQLPIIEGDDDAVLLQEAMRAQNITTVVSKGEKPKSAVVLDTLATPKVENNEVHVKKGTHQAIVMSRGEQATEGRTGSPVAAVDYTSSWILLAIIALFVLVAFRFRNNYKYLKFLMHETVDTGRRKNMFADTMRERSFAALLILLGLLSMSVLLSVGVEYSTGVYFVGELPRSIYRCMLLVGGYYIIQCIVYLCIGNIFAKREEASRWVKGFRATVALQGVLLLPAALVVIFYSGVPIYALIYAGIIYLLMRMLFIFKGIRIFSVRRSYFLLFLYYLCSVEIVPILLIWQLACGWELI